MGVARMQTAIRVVANAAAWSIGGAAPDPAQLVADAGLTPADAALVTEPLTILLRHCSEEADLSPLGRAGLRWDVARCLGNLRTLAEREAQDPAILTESITAPLVITGMPRSGTTFLQRLLATDPDSASPRCWQTLHPWPNDGPDRRRRDADRQMSGFALLAPELRALHPLDGDSPQECTEMTAQVFQSLRFETVYRVPGYKSWLAGHGHLEAYRFHRRYLQHLQRQAGRPLRWVLKCPDHVFAMDALRAVYPDAQVIFLHRDPLRVLPSVARLTEVLRRPFTHDVDRRDIGRQVLADWGRGADLLCQEAAYPRLPTALHLRYDDLVARPIATITRIDRHFRLALSAAARASMAALAARQPDGGYARNQYRADDFGLPASMLCDRFAEYARIFHVPAHGARRDPTLSTLAAG